MNKRKKILILGVTGQDGSFMAKLMYEKKYFVHGLVRKSSTGNLSNIKEILQKNNFFIHHGDLLDLVSIEKIIKKLKPDEIYNFADQDHVKWSFELPSYSFAVTGGSVVNILEIIKKHSHKSKFFQPLSSNMFGNSVNSKQNENEPLTPAAYTLSIQFTCMICCHFTKSVYAAGVKGSFSFCFELTLLPNMLDESG
jgi:GDPmannose 4,6-dehydratase